ncbi:MAG: rod shape-determining protein [Acidobacteriota bacterium]|nr:rod shape-determining protein [Acidobacteriota bacterium]
MYVEVGDEGTDIIVEAVAYGVISSYRSSIGSRALDEAVMLYGRRRYDLRMGDRTAEAIRQEIGSALPLEEARTMELRARHVTEQVPKTIRLTDEEIREALAGCVSTLVDGVRLAIERTGPEFMADIAQHGILLKGGEVLKNLDRRLTIETGLPVTVME